MYHVIYHKDFFNALEFDDFTIKKKYLFPVFGEVNRASFFKKFGSQIFATCKNPSVSKSLVCFYRQEDFWKGVFIGLHANISLESHCLLLPKSPPRHDIEMKLPLERNKWAM